jgi:hypothetical protein
MVGFLKFRFALKIKSLPLRRILSEKKGFNRGVDFVAGPFMGWKGSLTSFGIGKDIRNDSTLVIFMGFGYQQYNDQFLEYNQRPVFDCRLVQDATEYATIYFRNVRISER